MNAVDHDPVVARRDAYGNVTVNAKTYKGFTIDDGVTVKVWDCTDNYVGRFANVKAAKTAIRTMIASGINLNVRD